MCDQIDMWLHTCARPPNGIGVSVLNAHSHSIQPLHLRLGSYRGFLQCLQQRPQPDSALMSGQMGVEMVHLPVMHSLSMHAHAARRLTASLSHPSAQDTSGVVHTGGSASHIDPPCARS